MRELLNASVDELCAEARAVRVRAALARAEAADRLRQAVCGDEVTYVVTRNIQYWTRHMLRAREQQRRSGGFTEFVPLPAGVNDLGGTLMNESISRAAGAEHGQELSPLEMEGLIRSAGRVPRRRTTLYGQPPAEQVARSFAAPRLAPTVEPRAREAGLRVPVGGPVRP